MNYAQMKPTITPKTVVVTDALHHRHVLKVYGPLVDVHSAAGDAGVSHQRIYALIEQGRFTKFLIYGKVFLSHSELTSWSDSERKDGRPLSPDCQLYF